MVKNLFIIFIFIKTCKLSFYAAKIQLFSHSTTECSEFRAQSFVCRRRTVGWMEGERFPSFRIDTSSMMICFFRICSFSLRLHKENEPKEMRFAAVQIPAKIGVRSLNGEKLDVLNTFRTSSDSSPFFTLSRRRFLHAVIYKAARDTKSPRSF